MTADEPDESREPVVFRDETGDLVFVDGGPAPQGYAPVAWKLGEDGSRFVVDPTVDAVAVTRTISKRRPRRREPIE
ncbi:MULTISPECIES: hypothetical protein [Haloferax]|uniref:Uncharacterized protein n=5 Tax=Haloferax TaxID=2251 RepID=A0A6C0UVX7_HALVO|nr:MULTISPECIES: hypothetical protein [Haloferax]ELK44649.1 hypothetical protein D320_21610 [Haloferax sp. BAB-2207]ELZ76760.1 hypothetical protein C456_03716 [Haloferax lucentense DSM 14919]ELZ86281.1 hypothetical protein C452_17123 [Haloferax alexandrinus JCM 10717]MBC9987330.1 hypothetical protein [Haloferax sp. AS1]NLV04262.1 hypothetical protein [Haloferax alexandrinus]